MNLTFARKMVSFFFSGIHNLLTAPWAKCSMKTYCWKGPFKLTLYLTIRSLLHIPIIVITVSSKGGKVTFSDICLLFSKKILGVGLKFEFGFFCRFDIDGVNSLWNTSKSSLLFAMVYCTTFLRACDDSRIMSFWLPSLPSHNPFSRKEAIFSECELG